MKNASNELSEFIGRRISKNWGVGRIFNHIRKMKQFENIPNLGILRSVLVEFKRDGKSPSKNQILHHFRTKVPKEEWEGSLKSEIIADLCNPTP